MSVSRFVCSVLVVVACVVSLVRSEEPRPRETISARVAAVISGDTLAVLVDDDRVRVQLSDVDAPERGQPYAKESRSHLVKLAYKKDCQVVVPDRTKNGTVVGEVTVGEANLSREMLAAGWVWFVPPEVDEQCDEALADLEAKAWAEKLGISADPEPVAPWDWKKLTRSERATIAASSRSSSTVAGGDSETTGGGYWLNTSSGVRHNKTCEWYNNTRHGRYCSAAEGKPCGLCGG